MTDCCLAECTADTRVEANYLGQGSWNAATVSSVFGDTITLDWDDGSSSDRQNPSAQVRILDDSAVVCGPGPTCDDIDGAGTSFASCPSGFTIMEDLTTKDCASATCSSTDCCKVVICGTNCEVGIFLNPPTYR